MFPQKSSAFLDRADYRSNTMDPSTSSRTSNATSEAAVENPLSDQRITPPSLTASPPKTANQSDSHAGEMAEIAAGVAEAVITEFAAPDPGSAAVELGISIISGAVESGLVESTLEAALGIGGALLEGAGEILGGLGDAL